MAANNKTIGRFHLDGIPPAPRGVPQIEVTFDIDANGILNVAAKDKSTGKEQSIRIEASSGLSDKEIEKMKQEAKEHEKEDSKRKDEADKLNKADSLIFQTEKQLKEFGDKISEDKKKPIQDALEKLKEAHKNEKYDEIDQRIEDLNNAWQAASQEMYNAQQQTAGEQQTTGEQQSSDQQKKSSGKNDNGDGEVTDVDFEEVK
jgi:molecular chaperone DnaK